MSADGREIRLLRFGVFELELEAHELRRRGRLVPLPRQPFLVLARLAAQAGEVVTREELRRALWGETIHVDHERGLNYCVNRVRRALGDSAQAPRFVETLPGRGYRFLATAAVSAPSPKPQPDTRREARPTRPTLVLAAAVALAVQTAGVPRHSKAGGPGLPSPDPAAQAAFEKGRGLLDQGPVGWRRSVAWFAQAARHDPGFALARYGLADAYMRLGENGVLSADQAFPAAREAALQALEIEDRAEPLVILAAIELNYEWDWAGAEKAYLRALELDPSLLGARLGYARLLSAAGRHEEAIRLIRAAEARQPGCAEIVRDAGLAHYRAHRFAEAARYFRDWAELEPGARDPHHWLALLDHLDGRLAEAKSEARIVVRMAGASPTSLAEFDSLPPGLAMERYLRGCLQFLRRLSESQWVTADDFARIRAHLGERDRALDELEHAADERSPRLLPFLADPAFDTLRTEPRFRALSRRLRAPVRDQGDPRPVVVAAAPLG